MIVIESISGHDGFLVETEPLGQIIRRALELTPNISKLTVTCARGP